MTVEQLIEELKKFPQDMPVATDTNFQYPDGGPLEVSIHTWIHSNYPYNLPDTDYVNIE